MRELCTEDTDWYRLALDAIFGTNEPYTIIDELIIDFVATKGDKLQTTQRRLEG